MPDTYITKAGTVSLQHKDGTSPLYRYGDPVDTSLLTDGQLEHLDRVTGDNPGVKYDTPLHQQVAESQTIDQTAEFRAAMADAGQVNSTSSPVPSNYGELDEDEAAAFVRVLEQNPRSQALVVAHELRNGGRASVIDAATAGVKEIAKRYVDADDDHIMGPDVYSPGEAAAEPTPAAAIPEPTTIPEEAVQAFLDGDPPVVSTDQPGVPTPSATPDPDADSGNEDEDSPEDTPAEDLKGEALDAEGSRLEIEGFSGLSADDKRAAVAKARDES